MVRILNFGSLNVDHVYQVPHLVCPGETISSDSLQLFCGGKGLNQSIALARAGAQVYHAGAVGKQDGAQLLETLRRAGVHTEFVQEMDCESGHAVIQVDRQGQNSIIIFGGTNRKITPEQVKQTLDQFEKDDILVLQNEISQVGAIIKAAHEKGMQIAFNPSPIDAEIQRLPLELCSFLLLNEVEAQTLCPQASMETLMDDLRSRFPSAAIVLTLGAEGACYGAPGTEQILRQPAYRLPVKDTTAAGDTFTGYFLAALAEGQTAASAMALASVAAGIAVSRPGAEASIPFREEVEAQLNVLGQS